MFFKSTVSACALALVLSLGCAKSDMREVSAEQFKPVTGGQLGPENARLGEGGMLNISVEVDGIMEVAFYQTEINAMGLITLPLVGDVKVANVSLETARTIIAKAYGGYYVSDPVIILSRIDNEAGNEWGFVTVTGAVRDAGRVSIPTAKGLKLTAAISESGGFSPTAKLTDIRVTRQGRDGTKMRVSINYNDIGAEGDADADINLMQGDIVYVPQRIF